MSQKHLQFVNGQAKCNYHFKHYLLYTLNACKHTEVQKHLLQSSPLQIRGRFFLIFFFFPQGLTFIVFFYQLCFVNFVWNTLTVKCSQLPTLSMISQYRKNLKQLKKIFVLSFPVTHFFLTSDTLFVRNKQAINQSKICWAFVILI